MLRILQTSEKNMFRSCCTTVNGFVTLSSNIPGPGTLNSGNFLIQIFYETGNNSRYSTSKVDSIEGKYRNFSTIVFTG